MAAGIAIILLAAGASSRMRGRDKLLERIGGEPLLPRQTRAAIAASDKVYVVLDSGNSARAELLRGFDVEIVPVAPRLGMSDSIAAGVAALPQDIGGIVVLPADMPEIGSSEIKKVINVFRQDQSKVCRGSTTDGIPGHPVVFPARLRPALVNLSGDDGAKSLLMEEDVRLVALPGNVAITDLDTPEEWDDWRRAQDF